MFMQSFFFPFLFLGYFSSVDVCVICIVCSPCKWLSGSFQPDSCNFLSAFLSFLLGWQLLVLLEKCYSFSSLHFLFSINVIFMVCLSSLWALISFCVLTFVVILLFLKDAIFTLSRFFLTISDYQRTLHSAFGWVGMLAAAAAAAAAASLWTVRRSHIRHSEYVWDIFW